MPEAGDVVIGVVARPHGVRGGVRVRATGETLRSCATGQTVRVAVGDAPPQELVIATIGGDAAMPVVTFVGVDDRDAAARLSGGRVLVAQDRLVGGDDETFYRFELVGMAVRYGERSIGVVREVIETPANDVLVVETASGEVLVPFTLDAVPVVDRAERLVVVRGDLFPDGEGP